MSTNVGHGKQRQCVKLMECKDNVTGNGCIANPTNSVNLFPKKMEKRTKMKSPFLG